jgi:hypothetical protein
MGDMDEDEDRFILLGIARSAVQVSEALADSSDMFSLSSIPHLSPLHCIL